MYKTCGNQNAVLNLDADERFKPRNILLPVVTRASVYKKHGMARVRNGVDQDGVQHDEPNYAADARELDEGRWITIPNDRGGTECVRLRVAVLFGAMDYLGAQSCTVHQECPNSNQFCRACDYDRRSSAAGKPFSFLRRPAPVAGEAKTCRAGFSLRDWAKELTALSRVRAGVSAAEKKRIFAEHAFNKLYGVYDPEYLPHANPAIFLPQDILHLFPDGLLRSEAAWLLYILCLLGLELDEVNLALLMYPNWPPDVRIPPLQAKLKKGRKNKTPKPGATISMTGSECMHFALHRCDVRLMHDSRARAHTCVH